LTSYFTNISALFEVTTQISLATVPENARSLRTVGNMQEALEQVSLMLCYVMLREWLSSSNV